MTTSNYRASTASAIGAIVGCLVSFLPGLDFGTTLESFSPTPAGKIIALAANLSFVGGATIGGALVGYGLFRTPSVGKQSDTININNSPQNYGAVETYVQPAPSFSSKSVDV